MRTKHDFSITQQTTETISLEIVDSAGVPRSLAGLDFKLDCRQQPNAPEPFFTMSSADGTIQLDHVHNHKIWLHFGHDMTKQLSFDKGVYDLLAYLPDKSSVEILMQGQVTLNKTVTKLD